jgi:hypothetical protein
MNIKWTVLLVTITLLNISAHAQTGNDGAPPPDQSNNTNEPSMAETENWICSKINGFYTKFKDDGSWCKYEYYGANISADGILTLNWRYTVSGKDLSMNDTYTATVRLSDLDPDAVRSEQEVNGVCGANTVPGVFCVVLSPGLKVNKHILAIHYKHDDTAVGVRTADEGDVEGYPGGEELWIVLGSGQGFTDRIAKAFRHDIRLHGGHPMLQPKEPF